MQTVLFLVLPFGCPKPSINCAWLINYSSSFRVHYAFPMIELDEDCFDQCIRPDRSIADLFVDSPFVRRFGRSSPRFEVLPILCLGAPGLHPQQGPAWTRFKMVHGEPIVVLKELSDIFLDFDLVMCAWAISGQLGPCFDLVGGFGQRSGGICWAS